MNSASRITGSSKIVPSVELPLTISQLPLLSLMLGSLYTLSFMRNNSIKTVILLFEPNLPINEVVERAKKYCKEKSVNFTWIEKSIVDLTKETE